MTSYITDRGVWFLVLSQVLAICVFIAGLAFIHIGRRDIRNAYAHTGAVDSVWADWVKRGCAPRSQALP